MNQSIPRVYEPTNVPRQIRVWWKERPDLKGLTIRVLPGNEKAEVIYLNGGLKVEGKLSVNPAEPSPHPPRRSHVPSSNIPSDSSIKLNLTQVNGLLVMPLGVNEYAAKTSVMTLTAVASNSKGRSELKFSQEVGDTMDLALEEVARFIEIRNEFWPKEKSFSISFENKYSPKDGPSGAVACALLLESAFSGCRLDPRFAVTGDLNADGSVQAVGGVGAKIRGCRK